LHAGKFNTTPGDNDQYKKGSGHLSGYGRPNDDYSDTSGSNNPLSQLAIHHLVFGIFSRPGNRHKASIPKG
jgi:hypothetical protein